MASTATDGGKRSTRRPPPPKMAVKASSTAGRGGEDLTTADDGGIRRKPFAGYPGGKDAAGSAQKIIGFFPPHGCYIECCLGGGAVMRMKAPALHTIGIDANPDVVRRWKRARWPGAEIIQADAIEWLKALGPGLPDDALVYADPPYIHSTRTRRRTYGAFEMSDREHARLLAVLSRLRCNVFLSGYDNPLYRKMLRGWNHESWRAMTRGGVRIEHLWFKVSGACSTAVYGVDGRRVGGDYRERERIKKKAGRWVERYLAMPRPERAAVLQAVLSAAGGTAVHGGGPWRADATRGL